MKELNTTSFAEVIASDKPVVVDFWAAWCGPCRMMAPVLEEIESDMGERAQICKINIDDFPNIAARYGVDTIPTMIVFKAGEEQERLVGVRPKTDITEMIKRAE